MKGHMLQTIFWSAVGGALVWWIILGAVWGWMTPASAERMAEKRVDTAVIKALTPICVAQFNQEADKGKKLTALQKTSSWGREDFVIKQGWATMPGAEEPQRQVADACADSILNGSTS